MQELIVERLESHQHAIETTTWELDLCCSRAHILIELVQVSQLQRALVLINCLQSQVEYFDKYELSFMAATILRIPVCMALGTPADSL